MMNYSEVCDYIEGIVRYTTKHSNQHTRKCLSLLGNPDQAFSTIHIAGTNGKGSTCAFLASVLNRASYRTGLFISPHLSRINERIQLCGQEISDEALIRVFEQVRQVSEQMERSGDGHPSYFEFLFLMGMVYFREQHADVVIVETGLGGRMDATNALVRPAITVITAIGMDHMQYLGNTIEEIAGEKAGIIKEAVPCVYVADSKEAAAVISRHAKNENAPAYPLTKDMYRVTVSHEGTIDFSTMFRYDEIQQYRTKTYGTYQAENGALSVLALSVLKKTDPIKWEKLTEEVIKEGILEMYWPGRMERVRPHIYLDGAHNDNGIERLTESIRNITGGKPAGLVFAVVNDKDFTDMIRSLSLAAPWDFVYVSEAGGDRKTDAAEIGELFRKNHISNVEVIRDPEEAFLKASLVRHGSEELFVCGSLYLIGRIKQLLNRES